MNLLVVCQGRAGIWDLTPCLQYAEISSVEQGNPFVLDKLDQGETFTMIRTLLNYESPIEHYQSLTENLASEPISAVALGNYVYCVRRSVKQWLK